MVKNTLILMTVFVICSAALADRQLERSEILDILTAMTQTPTKSWVTSGSIEAAHEEYRAPRTTDSNEIDLRIAEEVQAYKDNPSKIQLTEKLQAMKAEAIPFNVRYELSNEYTMSSTVVVRVDGDKFYWQINVDSRTDSVKKPADLEGNFLTDEFDLNCNEERIFAWDGEKYTTYFKPVNHAIVTDTPSGVNGPLTAGVIRWGHGSYTMDNLYKADLTGLETEIDSREEIQLTVLRTDGTEETFILDPDRAYAVKQYSAQLPNNIFVLQVYGNYRQVAGKWCPGNILTEKHDTTQSPHRLLARDIWDFTSIDERSPSSTAFEVSYQIDAYIEDFCFGAEPLQYRYSAPQPPLVKRIDTDELIRQRLMIQSAAGRQNCATASLKYVCDNLGADCSLETFSSLVHGEKNSTTLAQIKHFAEDLGLDARAARIDIEALKTLSDYQVIVHLPTRDHFVVVGDIDDKYVRLIDLSSNRLYDRYSIDSFDAIWDGMALLVSKNQVKLAGSFTEIDNAKLTKIVGAADCEQCNTPCSRSGNSPCNGSPPFCGSHRIYFSRTCCGSAESGTCSESSLIYESTESCITDPDTLDCAGFGDWTSSTMDACE